MKKQVAVIGLGRFGVGLANTLLDMGYDVLALDVDEDRVQAVASQVSRAIHADATDEAVLRGLGIDKFDVAIVSMGSDIEHSVLTTILLRKLGVPLIVARADNELHGTILDKIGADKVIYPEREMGTRVAHGLMLTNVLDYMSVDPSYGLAKIVPPGSFVGRTLSELGLGPQGRWEVAVLLIRREREVIIGPDRMEVVRPDDILIVSGSDVHLEQLMAEARKSAREEDEEED
ncbi:MAG: TrkA family potassium uptake protein [Chloroflexi bacterium]|nr:TrkA family potassium uptake protein [Chloroflexota bacterium]